MALSSAGGITGYPTSVLRYGLIDVKPLEIREIVKRAGVKFLRVSRVLKHDLESYKSYSDFITSNNQAIFDTIPIPKWSAAEELVKIYSERSIRNYEADTEFKNAAEALRQGVKDAISLSSFINFVLQRLESRMADSLESEAERFLNSNLQLSFFSKFVVLDYTLVDYLKAMKQMVRHYEIRSMMPRARSEFRMFSKVMMEMKGKIAPVIDQMDVCLLSYIRLDRYIELWKSESYDELFKSKFLDIRKLDYSAFNELDEIFKIKHTEARKFLLGIDPKIFHSEVRLGDDPTAKMFSKLFNSPLPASYPRAQS